MNVNTLLNSAAASSNSSAAASQTASADDPKSQRDLFMTLLVAQLKNQDPMEPQDGTQFVAQLAQFNSLDQLTNIRQGIDQLVAALSQAQTAASSSAATSSKTSTSII